MRWAALAAAVWLWAAPALGESLPGVDLRANQKLQLLGQDLQKGGDTLEQWILGRLGSQAAQTRLASIRVEAERHRSELKAIAWPPAGQDYGRLAVEAASSRIRVLDDSARLIADGQPTNQSLRKYFQTTLEVNRAGLGRWFSSRRDFTGKLPGLSPRLAEYYHWLQGVLEDWKSQSELASDAQQFLGSPGNGASREQAALNLERRSLGLYQKVAGRACPSWLKEAQQATAEEALGLVKVCEAVHLWVDDPGPDSVTRLRRALRVLGAAASRSEDRALKALAETRP